MQAGRRLRVAQDLSDTLIAAIAGVRASDALKAEGVKAGDPFDREVGGLADESAGAPVRIQGTVRMQVNRMAVLGSWDTRLPGRGHQ